jgi:hypothetical protein
VPVHLELHVISAHIDYRRDKQARFLSCFYRHVSQELRRDGYKDKGSGRRWKHVVIPLTDGGDRKRGREAEGPGACMVGI